MNELEQLLGDIEQATSDNGEKMFGAVAAITEKHVAECAEVHRVAEWYEARCLMCDWTTDGENHDQVVSESKLHVFHTRHEIHIDIKNIESVLPKPASGPR